MEQLIVDFPGINTYASDHLTGYAMIIEANSYPNEMKSYSFVISEGEYKAVYTSDIPDLKHLCEKTGPADIFIVDAIHLPLEELNCALTKGHKRIILNHGLSEEIRLYLENNNINGVEIAQESKDLF
jgi:hypothetical protein